MCFASDITVLVDWALKTKLLPSLLTSIKPIQVDGLFLGLPSVHLEISFTHTVRRRKCT